MPKLIDRLPALRQVREKHLSTLEQNYASKEKDKDGSATNSLAGTLRFLAVAAFALDSDCEIFRSRMGRVAELRKELFIRAQDGESISPSYLSMLAYKQLFCALASGDMGLSCELANMMGGRTDIEAEHDHPFDKALGYALKSAVLSDERQSQHLEVLERICSDKDNLDFAGYYRALAALANGDENEGNKALKDIVKAHKKQSKGRGVFAGSEDEVLCVWGIGIANLLSHNGLTVECASELLPKQLVI